MQEHITIHNQITTTKEKFLALDAFRGWAAVGVVIFHLRVNWPGYLMVDFFLVLSGFILAHTYLLKEKKVTTEEFIFKRVARLLPLHAFTLGFYIAAVYIHNGKLPNMGNEHLFTYLQQLLMLHNIGMNNNWLILNYPSWTISVEFWINVVFFYFISRRTRSIPLLLIYLLTAIILYHEIGHINTSAENLFGVLNSGLIRCIGSFSLGVLAYKAYIMHKYNYALHRYISIFEIICIIAFYFCVYHRPEHLALDILTPILFMLIVFIYSFERGIISWLIMKTSPLGLISYSIYLNQIPVLELFNHYSQDCALTNSEQLWIYFTALFTISCMTYYCVEKPGRVLILKISKIFLRPTVMPRNVNPDIEDSINSLQSLQSTSHNHSKYETIKP